MRFLQRWWVVFFLRSRRSLYTCLRGPRTFFLVRAKVGNGKENGENGSSVSRRHPYKQPGAYLSLPRLSFKLFGAGPLNIKVWTTFFGAIQAASELFCLRAVHQVLPFQQKAQSVGGSKPGQVSRYFYCWVSKLFPAWGMNVWNKRHGSTLFLSICICKDHPSLTKGKPTG